MKLALLERTEWAGGVESHIDFLSAIPTSLSRKRAQRLGKPKQKRNPDNKGGVAKCLFCNPERLQGKPTLDYKVDKHVAGFENAAPYMPYHQRVMYMWDDDEKKRKDAFHRFKMGDVRREELFFLLKAAVEYGREFSTHLLKSCDLPRMIFGFNLGKLAGQ